MNLPTFITFTGVDSCTDVRRMADLSERYPIEWGILFSASRARKENRYPAWDDGLKECIQSTKWRGGKRFAAHLCGRYARDVAMHGRTEDWLEHELHSTFGRAQINIPPDLRESNDAVNRICAWGMINNLTPILQCSADFAAGEGRPSMRPAHASAGEAGLVQWLFDQSGGRGQAPMAWPYPPFGVRSVGYAGGLNPDNVAAAVQDIGAKVSGAWWIDMESGVRDVDDWFSLDKCEAVCRAVYRR